MGASNQNQNLFLTAHSMQNKSVISVLIKDIIHHYPRVLFYDIPRVGRTFMTYPGRGAVLQHTRVKGIQSKTGMRVNVPISLNEPLI